MVKENARVQIVGQNSNLQELSEQFQKTTSIWIPVLQHKERSHFESKISFIYIYNLDLEKDYLLGITHYDLPKLSLKDIYENFSSVKKVVLNSSYLPEFKTSIDASLINWYNTNEDYKFGELVDLSRLNLYYRLYKFSNITDYIPIMIYVDICRGQRDLILIEIQKFLPDESFKIYNKLILKELTRIEGSGIYINKEVFMKSFGKIMDKNIVYTKFNPLTKTGRPSSHFNNVNYSALNKSDGSRAALVSRYNDGFLLEFDYDSCHLRLVSNLINYKLPQENTHIYFGKKYFNTDEITTEQYEKSKNLSFKELYGETNEDTDIEYFIRVKDFKKKLFTKYKKNGYIETPIFKRKILKRYYAKMNRNKLFNYLIQAYETEYNINIIKEVNDYLTDKKTKMILYTYDSFLFDYSRSDGKQCAKDLKDLVNKDMPIKVKYGTNYNEMIDIKLT